MASTHIRHFNTKSVLIVALALLVTTPALSKDYRHWNHRWHHSQSVDGTCGTSSGQTLSAAPTTDLCDTGNATDVITTHRRYRWSCDGTGGGTTAHCTAKINQSATTTPVNGTCGSANSQTLSAAPTTNLCGTGTASTVSGQGPWTWSCAGTSGGTTTNCTAALQAAATSSACGTYSSGSTYTLTTSSTSGTTPATTAQCPNGGTVPTLTVVTQQYTCANGVQTAKGSPVSTTTNAAAVCNSSGGGQVCPALAKLCPDGSSVTASGPNCTFPACPSTGASCGTYASGTTWTTTATTTGTTAATAAQCPAGGTVPTSTTTTTTYACTNGTQSVSGTPTSSTTVTGSPTCAAAASCGTHASGSTYTLQTSQTTGAEVATAAQCPNGGSIPTTTTVTQTYICTNGTQTASGSPTTTTTTTGSPTCAAAASCGSYPSGSTYTLQTSQSTGTGTATAAQCPNGGTVPTLTTTTQAYTCTNGIQTAQGSPKTSTTSAGQAVCSTTTSETREYWQQPGGAGSVWNTPLGDGAVWGSANDADTQSLRHGGNINPADYFSVEIWTGKPSDPVETVTGSPTVGNNDNSTIQIHVPAGAYTSSGGDGNTDFWDATNYPGLSLHVGQAQFNGNSVTGVMTETDNAMSDTFGEDQETGLTGYDTAAGSITGYDMQQIGNGGHMRHMLRYATDAMYLKDAGTNGSNKLGPTSWPQAYEDWQSGINVYTGNLPAGTTVGIPMTTAMPANLTRGGQELFWTLQHYGALFRDQAGGGMNFDVDQIAQASSLIDDMRTDLPQIVQLLAPLRNQHVGGQSFTASPINGPGNRVDSGPPPLAPL